MSDGDRETDKLAEFLFASIEREPEETQIRKFIRAVLDQPELANELVFVGSRLEDIAAYAANKGYAFSPTVLETFLERRIRTTLQADALRLRDTFLARRQRGDLPAPTHLDEPCVARLIDEDYRAGYQLDRATVLHGDVVVVRGVPALKALAARLRAHLERFFQPHDPWRAHEIFDAETLREKVKAFYAETAADSGIPPLMPAFASEIGMQPEDVVYEWPGLRLIRPNHLGGGGHYRDGNTGSVGAHRDTWYGSPQHQINFWTPLRSLPGKAALHLFTGYYRRSVKNSSHGYDIWRGRVGLQLNPTLLQSIDASAPIYTAMDVGDVLCFAGHQLHGSGINSAEQLRISMEFRLLNQVDSGADYVPPNIDYHGFGTIYDGWYPCDSVSSTALSVMQA